MLWLGSWYADPGPAVVLHCCWLGTTPTPADISSAGPRPWDYQNKSFIWFCFTAFQPLEVLLPGDPATSIPGLASPLAELWAEDEESATSGTRTPSSKSLPFSFFFMENPPCKDCRCYLTLFNISVTVYKSHKNNRSTLNTKQRDRMPAKNYLFKVNFRCRHESWCKESEDCPQPVCQISQLFTIWS